MARGNSGAYLRMSMYIMTIVMHVANMAYMAMMTADQFDVEEDDYIRVYSTLQTRFFTCWTFFLQTVYAVLSLTCEWMLLKNSSNKKYKLPKYLALYRDSFFSAVIWPSSWVVFFVFWGLYSYDRALIYPEFVDKILTSLSNHVMHTFIIPVVFWEVLFRPRQVPKSHLVNVLYLMFHLAVYLCVMIYTYVETGIWIYPIFESLYGTANFIVALAVIFATALGAYYVQWPITRFLYQEPRKKVK